jgi:hypothetical protein
VAPLIYIFWYASGGYWHTAQPDAWAGGCVALAVVLAGGSSAARPLFYGLSGALVGVAALNKPHYAMFAALPALAAALTPGPTAVRLGACAAGFCATMTATVAWFFSFGALDDFLFAFLVYPLTTYSTSAQLTSASAVAALADYLLPASVLLIAAPAIVMGMVTALRRAMVFDHVLIAWTVLAVVAIMAQRRFFEYHWAVALPPFALLTARGISRIAEVSSFSPGRRLAGWSYLALLVARLVASPALETLHFAAWQTGLESEEAFEAHFGTGGVERQAAAALRKELAPGDRVAVWGLAATVGYLTDTPPVSRFQWPPDFYGRSPQLDVFMDEYVDALRRVRPRFIVEGREYGSLNQAYRGLETRPEVAAFVAEHYRLARVESHLWIYERRGP